MQDQIQFTSGGQGTVNGYFSSDFFSPFQQQLASGVDQKTVLDNLKLAIEKSSSLGIGPAGLSGTQYNDLYQNAGTDANLLSILNGATSAGSTKTDTSGIPSYVNGVQVNNAPAPSVALGTAPATAPASPAAPAPTTNYGIVNPAVDPNAQAEAEYQARLKTMQGGTTNTGTQSSYSGPSIVDYLNSVGQDSSFAARKAMAVSNGISNYTGSADQNTQLLNALRGANTASGPGIDFSKTTGTTNTGTTSGSTTNTPPSYQDILAQAYQALGVNPPDPTVNPITKAANDYQAAATALGVPTINAQLKEIQTQTDKLNSELQDKILKINQNPWLSEGIRAKNIEQLKDSYAVRLDTLAKEQTLYQNLFDKADQQAQYIVTQANGTQKELMDKAVTLAGKVFDSLSTPVKDTDTTAMKEYALAASQGYPGTFLDYQKEAANLKTTSTSGSGTTKALTSGSLSYTPADIGYGQTILDQSKGEDGFVDPNIYLQMYQKWTEGGGLTQDFLKQYPPKLYVNPANTWLPTYLMPAKAGTSASNTQTP